MHPLLIFLDHFLCSRQRRSSSMADVLMVKVASRNLGGDPSQPFLPFFEFTHLLFVSPLRLNHGLAVPPGTPTAQLASIVCN